MLSAVEQTQSGQCSAADGGARNHALNGQFHRLGRTLFHEGVITDRLKVADITGVTIIEFLLQLFAGENCLCAVNDNDMIPQSTWGAKVGLCLPRRRTAA